MRGWVWIVLLWTSLVPVMGQPSSQGLTPQAKQVLLKAAEGVRNCSGYVYSSRKFGSGENDFYQEVFDGPLNVFAGTDAQGHLVYIQFTVELRVEIPPESNTRWSLSPKFLPLDWMGPHLFRYEFEAHDLGLNLVRGMSQRPSGKRWYLLDRPERSCWDRLLRNVR